MIIYISILDAATCHMLLEIVLRFVPLNRAALSLEPPPLRSQLYRYIPTLLAAAYIEAIALRHKHTTATNHAGLPPIQRPLRAQALQGLSSPGTTDPIAQPPYAPQCTAQGPEWPGSILIMAASGTGGGKVVPIILQGWSNSGGRGGRRLFGFGGLGRLVGGIFVGRACGDTRSPALPQPR